MWVGWEMVEALRVHWCMGHSGNIRRSDRPMIRTTPIESNKVPDDQCPRTWCKRCTVHLKRGSLDWAREGPRWWSW